MRELRSGLVRIVSEGGCHGWIPTLVHLAFLLLAARAACADTLSVHLADSAAVSHRGHRRGGRFVVLAIPLFSPGADFARATRNLMCYRLFVSK